MSSDHDSAAAEEFKMEVAKKLRIKRDQVAGVRKQSRIDHKAAVEEHEAKKKNGSYVINGVDTDIFVDRVFRDTRAPIETWLHANPAKWLPIFPKELNHISGWLAWAEKSDYFREATKLLEDIKTQIATFGT